MTDNGARAMTECDGCGAPLKAGRHACEYCRRDYPGRKVLRRPPPLPRPKNSAN